MFKVIPLKLVVITCVLFLCSCISQSNESVTRYYTWEGLEPDRWASIWLMKRHIDPAANISILPVGAALKNSKAIATPFSEVKRTHGKSTYENLVTAYKQNNDATLLKIGAIINELEISPWNKSSPVVLAVETAFRELQYRYDRDNVPPECYAGFFDALYITLENTPSPTANALSKALDSNSVCHLDKQNIASRGTTKVVEYSTQHVLSMIHANRKVVFVDTREDAEFGEKRIPHAMNIKLREVNASHAKQLNDADLVIAYCIKDFRGYEVAKALKEVGVKNIGIMNPFGLKGWIDSGLPIANSTNTDAMAYKKLRDIAANGIEG